MFTHWTPKRQSVFKCLKTKLGKVSSGGSTLHLRFDQYSQVMTCEFALAEEKWWGLEWRRWETAAGELFLRRIQCINVLLLSAYLSLRRHSASVSLHFAVMFDQRLRNRYSLPSPLCFCFCATAMFMSYRLVHTATSQLQPLFDVWYM